VRTMLESRYEISSYSDLEQTCNHTTPTSPDQINLHVHYLLIQFSW
jgi:hypothetical protein